MKFEVDRRPLLQKKKKSITPRSAPYTTVGWLNPILEASCRSRSATASSLPQRRSPKELNAKVSGQIVSTRSSLRARAFARIGDYRLPKQVLLEKCWRTRDNVSGGVGGRGRRRNGRTAWQRVFGCFGIKASWSAAALDRGAWHDTLREKGDGGPWLRGGGGGR